jgi:AraC-like DNA-binding protein
MKLYIEGMISNRCKIFVEEELQKIGLNCTKVNLGSISIEEEKINPIDLEKFKTTLLNAGLKLIYDEREILVDRIKVTLFELLDSEIITGKIKINYSDYLSKKLNFDYTYLSNIFSKSQGITIEHFNIINKVEKIKQYILYDNLSIKEISNKLGYSSTSHLSNQFKKFTGLTPTEFKNQVDIVEKSVVPVIPIIHGIPLHLPVVTLSIKKIVVPYSFPKSYKLMMSGIDMNTIPLDTSIPISLNIKKVIVAIPAEDLDDIPLPLVITEIKKVQVILNDQILMMQNNLCQLIFKQLILEKKIAEIYKSAKEIHLRGKELNSNFPKLPPIKSDEA